MASVELLQTKDMREDQQHSTHDRIIMENPSSKYSLPENYNPSDYPAVKLRNKNPADSSETQRKRRSKNRLSNRRSTGYVPRELIDSALEIGPDGKIDASQS